jgi:predicted nucleic acid-binding protein
VARRLEILADTSGIIALLDRDDRHHRAAVKAIEAQTILIPATILPEVDYLSSKYLGEQVASAFLKDLVEGRFTYQFVELEDLDSALKIMARYQGVPLGLVDASLVALAERYRISKVLTLDRRHFSLIKPERIDYLELLP